MPVHELAALGAAACWAITGILSQSAAQALGPFGFNRLRQGMVAIMLAVIVIATGRLGGIAFGDLWRLSLSGVVGIFLGDTLLYVTLIRLGPRRSGALFALNAPMAALMGWLALGESLSLGDAWRRALDGWCCHGGAGPAWAIGRAPVRDDRGFGLDRYRLRAAGGGGAGAWLADRAAGHGIGL
ncbi:EamA family transporter [Paracoccus kondratievae]